MTSKVKVSYSSIGDLKMLLFAVVGFCAAGLCLVGQVDCQSTAQQQIQYHQLQYEMQQKQQQLYEQQQYEYQKHQQQQYPSQFHPQQQNQHASSVVNPLPTTAQSASATVPLQQKDFPVSNENRLQSQMLKTGASLIVADGVAPIGSSDGQNKYYSSIVGSSSSSGNNSNDNGQQIGRRPGGRKRKRRPAASVSTVEPIMETNNQYWRGHVEDEDVVAVAASSSASPHREEIRNVPRRRKPIQQTTTTSPTLGKVAQRIREPLAALEKEQKLYEMRDRQRQEFVAEVTNAYRDKSYRRPYSQAKKDTIPQQSQKPLQSVEISPNKNNSSSQADLKNILKNSGGLSLSEILQQKNLSLDDLLKGKQNALLALQTTAISPPSNHKKQQAGRQPKPLRKVPQQQQILSNHSEEEHQDFTSEPISSSNEDLDRSNRKNLKFPALHRVRLFGTSSRSTTTTQSSRERNDYDGETTRTTSTRRQETAAVSSSTTTTASTTRTRSSLYRKRQHKRPALVRPSPSEVPSSDETLSFSSGERDSEEDYTSTITTTKTTTTGASPSSTTTLEYSTSLPTTSSGETSAKSNDSIEEKLKQTNPEVNFVDNDGDGGSINSNTEVRGFENFFQENPMQSNGQGKQPTTQSKEGIIARSDHYPIRNDLSETIETTTIENTPDYDHVDDRTDLLELIEDRRSGNRLFKVLEQRNMTLEELIEHRKRGSSHLHLATIVQNRSRLFPGQKVVLNDNMDIVTAFENFPHFNLMNLKSVKPDEIKTDSQGSSYFTSIIDIEPTDEIFKEGKSLKGPSSSTSAVYAPQQQTEKSLSFFPSWKTLALASLTTSHDSENAAFGGNKLFFPSIENSNENSDDVSDDDDDNEQTLERQISDADPVEAIENEVARAHDLLDLELSGHGFKRSAAAAAAATAVTGNLNTSMPAGIRSAIVASAAIVITSIATFMVIFVVCRWKQRRRRKTNFLETYNAMKSKLPIISASSRQSSLKHMEELVAASSSISSTSAHQKSTIFPNSNRRSWVNAPAAGGATVVGGMSTSTSSISLSLQSPHNISTNKLNTMDPDSPEVQEYLFDTLRKSF